MCLLSLPYTPTFSLVLLLPCETIHSLPLAFLFNYFFWITYGFTGSRVSSGSIVSDYGLDDQAIGVRSPAGEKDFSSNLCVQTGSEVHPASCTMGTGVFSPGVKARPGRDADHSHPSSAEVENE
jgi:hypothetical protein